MSIIRVEIRVPEITRTLAAFADNRIKALEQFNTAIRESASRAINELLNAEITLFLGEPEQRDNKRNGYKDRNYTLKGVGNVLLRVPQDRKSVFKSSIIPANEQVDPRLKEDLAILYMAGISSRTLAMIANRLLDLQVSHSTVMASLNLVQAGAEKWLGRNLSSKYWALYIDGTNFTVQRQGTFALEPSLVVIGVHESNRRSILAIESGSKDSAEAWSTVFKSLKARGLDPSAVRLGIMDGLPGLEKAFLEAFPKASTGRCWIHAKRNVMVKCPARYAAEFEKLFNKVMRASSLDNARTAFATLTTAFTGKADKALKCLEKDLESLLNHYKFDKQFWLALKTTNPIERVNKEFKRRSHSMEHVGEDTLKVLLVFTAMRLEVGWRRHGIQHDNQMELLTQKRINKNKIEEVTEELLH